MYIIPNGDVYVLRGIDIDNGYSHTLFSKDAQEQRNKFFAMDGNNYKYVKYKLSDTSRGGYYTYQRINNNKIRVGMNANNLYDCNYLIFDNTRSFVNNDETVVNYGTTGSVHKQKWFFAFIDEINYINEKVSEIVYTIDIMQTYMFDYTINACYVEREHTVTDNLFEHIKPDYTVNGIYVQKRKADVVDDVLFGAVILNKEIVPDQYDGVDIYNTYDGIYPQNSSASPANSAPNVYVYGGFPVSQLPTSITGDFHYVSKDGDPYKFADFLNDIVKGNLIGYNSEGDPHVSPLDESNILATYTYSSEWSSSGRNWTNQHNITNASFTATNDITVSRDDEIDGYTPLNRKCYTYNYNRILASDYNGNTKTYAYELFNVKNEDYTFRANAVYFLNPQVMIYPLNYKSYGTETPIMTDYCLTKTNYPTPLYVGDYFHEWYNQNKTNIWLNAITNAIASGVATTSGVLSDNIALVGAGAVGAIKSVSNPIATAVDLDRRGGRGYISGTQDFMGSSKLVPMGIGIFNECLKSEYMKMVDNFFDLYGYAVDTLKKPNIIAQRETSNRIIRLHWNYIKTQNCDIHTNPGYSCPSSVKKKIEEIYNKGITFWNDLSKMGDYSSRTENTAYYTPPQE